MLIQAEEGGRESFHIYMENVCRPKRGLPGCLPFSSHFRRAEVHALPAQPSYPPIRTAEDEANKS